jgi:hypothetical protein
MDCQKFGNPLERKIVTACSTTFLHSTNSPFNFWYVFVGAGQVDNRTTQHCIDQGLEWCKFPIRMQYSDAEASLEIVLIYLFEGSKNCRNGSVREMVDSRETYLTTECQKERDLVDEEYICRQEHF